jgi:hypothetical protein
MRLIPLLILLLLAACAADQAPPTVSASRGGQDAGLRTKVVLVAAESSIKAFDNATSRFAGDLVTRAGVLPGDIHRFSARVNQDTERSDIAGVMRSIATLDAGGNDACLVFMTGHGLPGKGIVFPYSNDYLGPAQLDHVLTTGCGNRPTVVVLSACYSGVYSSSRVARDNRIIITAARKDRTSFGCGVRNQYTYFDGCFLSAFEDPRSRTWEDVSETAIACVSEQERLKNFLPSEPRLVVGNAVAGLPLPTGR